MSVVVGVITAPFHFNQRFWMRNLVNQPNMYFVLGSEKCYRNNIMNYLFLEEENRTYNDIVSVGGPECTKLSTVVKTRRWFEYALKFNTAWIAKTDDDVVWNPQKLHAEINMMQPNFAYHGVMRWRLYSQNKSNVCGKFMHVSPPKSHPLFYKPRRYQL